MQDDEGKALVPVVAAPRAKGEARPPAVDIASRALALAARSPAVRRAAMAAVAFGLGYQVSRMLRAGRLADLAAVARDVYRANAEGGPEAEGRVAGGLVRQSVTVVAAVYRTLDRTEHH